MTYRDLPETIDSLNDRMRDVLREVVASNNQVSRIVTHPMADGSGRWAITADLVSQGGLEWTHQIIAPAPLGAPAWAQQHSEYETRFPEASVW